MRGFHLHSIFFLVMLMSALIACSEEGSTEKQTPGSPAVTSKDEPATPVAPVASTAEPEIKTDIGAKETSEEAMPLPGKPDMLSHPVVYQDEIYINWPYTEAPPETQDTSVKEIMEDQTETIKAMVEEQVAAVEEEVSEMVAPMADVVQEATPPETVIEEKQAGAQPIDGRKIYNTYCAICHKAGMNAAPKYGSKPLWAKRIAQGRETVYANSINGLRGMPPRGGFKLTDEEVKAGVDYMVRGSGGWGDK